MLQITGSSKQPRGVSIITISITLNVGPGSNR